MATVEKNSPATDTWSKVAPMPAAPKSHCAVSVRSDMYVIDGHPACNSVLKFDSNGIRSEGAPMPDALYSRATCALGTHIYVFGWLGDDHEAAATTYRYDTEVDEWATLEPMPEPRIGHASVVLGGLIYILEGRQHHIDLRSVVRSDPVSGPWSRVANMSTVRAIIRRPLPWAGTSTPRGVTSEP